MAVYIYTMRRLIPLIALVALLSACQSPGTVFYYEEDAYFTQADARAEMRRRSQASQNEPSVEEFDRRYQETRQTNATNGQENGFQRDEFGNIIISNDFDRQPVAMDDYHDYTYSARVRRFGQQSGSWNYYDPFHTNHYWYSHNPGNWGMSIYNTYPWWARPGMGHNFWMHNPHWGHAWNPNFHPWNPMPGWHNPWHNPWGNPHCGFAFNPWNPNPWGMGMGMGWGMGGGAWGPGFMGGMGGMGGGFMAGGMYFNSFDQNTYHHGPRQFGRTQGGGGSGSGGGGGAPVTFARVVEGGGISPRERQPIRGVDLDGIRSSAPLPSTTRTPGVRTPTSNDRMEGTSTRGSDNRASGTDGRGVATPTRDGVNVREDNRNTEGSPTRSRFDNRRDNGMVNPDTDRRNTGTQNPTRNDDNRRRGSFQEGSRSPSWDNNNQRAPQPQRQTSPPPQRQTSPPPQRHTPAPQRQTFPAPQRHSPPPQRHSPAPQRTAPSPSPQRSAPASSPRPSGGRGGFSPR
jgi:hypothetical protein